MDTALDPIALNRLKWRCRRGLLENDLLIERFFRRFGPSLGARQAEGLQALIDLGDHDLLDLLLGRVQPVGGLDRPVVHEVLAQLRTPAAGAAVELLTAKESPS
jgi:antitoxin CptB